MRKIKEILRLHALGLSQRQIAVSCAIGQATVSEYLKAAQVAGLKWPEIADWGEDRLAETVAPPQGKAVRRVLSPEPDYAGIRHQLQTSKHVTLQLLWEEYRETHPEGYRYSRFCDLYRRWLHSQEVVLRQEHRAGEKLFVDFAGDTIPLYSAVPGEVMPAQIFVAVLGASNYTYAEATATQGLADWIGAHIRTFEVLGGVPAKCLRNSGTDALSDRRLWIRTRDLPTRHARCPRSSLGADTSARRRNAHPLARK